MNLTEDKKKIINRVKKLLLKHDGCKKINSEYEAEAALRLAFNLVEQHHLNMSDIMTESVDNEIEIVDLECEAYIGNKIPLYLSNIIQIVNLVCNTYCLIRRTDTNKSAKLISTNFIGESKDVPRAISMYNFFKKVAHKLANRHRREVNGNFTNWRSFIEGFTSRLLEKAIDFKNNKKKKIKKHNDEKDGLVDISGEPESSFDDQEDLFENRLTSTQEIQVYNYQEKVRKKIKEFIDSKNFEYEKIKMKTKVDMKSYTLGRIVAENYSVEVKDESKQIS